MPVPPVPLAAGPAQPGRLVWLAAPLRRRREAVVSPWRPAQPGKQVRLLAAVSLRRLAPRDCLVPREAVVAPCGPAPDLLMMDLLAV